MKIVCISDTHSMHDEIKLPPGDMLIIAGDICNHGLEHEVIFFNQWIKSIDYKYKIVIAGNHDWYFQKRKVKRDEFDFTYLQDESIIIEGIKIYGSPWQPEFYNWAFNLPRGELIKAKWDMIPRNTDILITHGPPLNYGDLTLYGKNVGCADLLNAVNRIKPKYHIFGHIHPAYGIYKNDDTTFINASVCNEQYEPINKPVVININSEN